ncbi:MAG: hypothetical protein KGD57_10020 [Candidatus Lokiarchaeota archaeon]|nr:hypothetical protein [Candidatus Lokiarchaeota archaeon]
MELEIIKVGNGTKEYFGNFTKKEIKIIKENCIGKILHLFSGNSDIGNMKVDYSNKKADWNCDVFGFLDTFRLDNYNTVIIDAPYNKKFADKYQKLDGLNRKQFIIFANTRDTTKLFNLIKENINPDIIIIKSWNYYIPKGYKLKKGYLCYAGGYRKSTILLILEKIPMNDYSQVKLEF